MSLEPDKEKRNSWERWVERRLKQIGQRREQRHAKTRVRSAALEGENKQTTAPDKAGRGAVLRSVLDARRRHGNRLNPNDAEVQRIRRPLTGRRRDQNLLRCLAREHELLHRALDLLRRLLLLRFLRLGDGYAKLTRFARIEGLAQRRADGQHMHIASEHSRPGKHLHHVPDRAIGADPSEEKTGDGDSASHSRQGGTKASSGKSKNREPLGPQEEAQKISHRTVSGTLLGTNRRSTIWVVPRVA